MKKSVKLFDRWGVRNPKTKHFIFHQNLFSNSKFFTINISKHLWKSLLTGMKILEDQVYNFWKLCSFYTVNEDNITSKKNNNFDNNFDGKAEGLKVRTKMLQSSS